MRAIEHYQRAAEMISEVETEFGSIEEGHQDVIAAAHVHATLALAGATALQSYARVDDSDGELADWEHAAGGDAE